MQVKLTKYNVTLKDSITWGDAEEIKAVMINGAKMNNTGFSGYDGIALFNAKLKAIEKVVVKIMEGENEIKYSDDWARNLSESDGELLYAKVEEVSKKK
jgi:hypothetical protein